MMETILNIAQIILSVLMITFILLQARGAGLGGVFGGGGNVYMAKRGIEKNLFQATVVVAVLFFAVALANALI
jgi:preprotein translocase subunit SecG